MYVTSYIFALVASSIRFILSVVLSAYAHLVWVYFLFIDFAACALAWIFGHYLPWEHSKYVDDWVTSSLDFEREEVLYYYDWLLIPYASFFNNLIFSSSFIKVFWFFTFIIPFSHFTAAELSNEYLLFCCIVFSLFLLYDKIVATLADTFTPSLTALRISVSKKLVLLLEISSYQTTLLEQYSLVCATFEELTANVSALSTEKDEADYVVFDQALYSALVSSLHASFDLELQFASQQEFMEQAEVDVVALDDLVAELSEEIQDLFT